MSCEEKQSETKETVFGTPQTLQISHLVCCISVVGCGWCVAEWAVFLYFLWVYICVYVYSRVCTHSTLCMRLVEGFILWRAALPVAVVTTMWPSALSW